MITTIPSKPFSVHFLMSQELFPQISYLFHTRPSVQVVYNNQIQINFPLQILSIFYSLILINSHQLFTSSITFMNI